MQLTIEIPNEQLFNKILWFLDAFKSEGLKVISNKKMSVDSKKELDFSSFKVDSFKDVDGLEYQKKIRDEW